MGIVTKTPFFYRPSPFNLFSIRSKKMFPSVHTVFLPLRSVSPDQPPSEINVSSVAKVEWSGMQKLDRKSESQRNRQYSPVASKMKRSWESRRRRQERCAGSSPSFNNCQSCATGSSTWRKSSIRIPEIQIESRAVTFPQFRFSL